MTEPDPSTADAFVDTVTKTVREEVRFGWNNRSCIATTRVLIPVFTYFGVTARPLPVSVAVWNPAAWEMFVAQQPFDTWPDDAWSVGIDGSGDPTKEGGWDGHLVALVEIGGWQWLADGSLDQLSRPAKGIELEPVALRLTEGWDGAPQSYIAKNGLRLVYREMRAEGEWRQANDWKGRKSMFSRTSGAVIRRLRTEGISAPQ